MRDLLKNVENFLESISVSELKKNPKVAVKKAEIEKFVSKLNICLEEKLKSQKKALDNLLPRVFLDK